MFDIRGISERVSVSSLLVKRCISSRSCEETQKAGVGAGRSGNEMEIYYTEEMNLYAISANEKDYKRV